MNNIGIEVTPPKNSCVDPLCPFHGHTKVRGRLMKVQAVSVKASKMVVVKREYLHYIKRVMRYEKRTMKLHAHLSDCIDVKEDDTLIIGECRPLSKSISFVVLEKVAS
ncbi:MAG: 30S ribosomal protein S17 [Thaumarchaeota archaeon]|nr:30S ribosomal protein S17 [Nitrososphaerota archaeon]MCZ6725445.1 30S ribosomal protein S17 [Nitrososphaerota archaeon]